ncbi:YopX family protein [Empedobacter brevis]|uniref:YopX family protein n=1 Tax=Empedobacter brevis TaxID=247 RepID=UPI0023F0D5E5|nr:YopX family protein [Empedobacter brevis]
MREILFRGQRVDNGQWVYGSFVSYEKTFGIIEKENTEYTCDGGALEFLYTEVRFDTVSQFTGLLDKNGNKIFEGDKVKLGDSVIFVVKFINGAFRFKNSDTYILLLDIPKTEEIEIIGNIK